MAKKPEEGEETQAAPPEEGGGEVQPIAEPDDRPRRAKTAKGHVRKLDDLAPPADDALENLPPKPRNLQGAAKARAEIWASQSKKNLIHLCNVRGCYFPLTPLRDSSRQNDPVEGIDEDRDSKFVVGVCTWDKGHGEQPMYPPKKEEEI